MNLEDIKLFCTEHNIGPVEVCGIDSVKLTLTGKDGRTYHEIETNYWAAKPKETNDVAYVHCNLHHGGIILRPIFVKINDAWYSVVTGKQAPAGLPYNAEHSQFKSR